MWKDTYEIGLCFKIHVVEEYVWCDPLFFKMKNIYASTWTENTPRMEVGLGSEDFFLSTPSYTGFFFFFYYEYKFYN